MRSLRLLSLCLLLCLAPGCGESEGAAPAQPTPAEPTPAGSAEAEAEEPSPEPRAPEVADEASPESEEPPASTPVPVTEGAAFARFYFFVREGAVLVRVRDASPAHDGLYPNEPRFARLNRLVFDAVGRSDAEDSLVSAEVNEAFLLSTDAIPERLRRGAPVDVLGSEGWVRTRVTGVSTWADGHFWFVAFDLAEAPEGAMLAAVGSETRPQGAFSVLAEPLPHVSEAELPGLRAAIAQAGSSDDLSALTVDGTGRLQLPNGRRLVHYGFPYTNAEGPFDRGRCGEVGECARTGLLLYDRAGDGAQLVHGADDEELDGDSVWQVRAVFRDGRAVGVITSLDDIGHEELTLTRFVRDRVERQTLYYLMGG